MGVCVWKEEGGEERGKVVDLVLFLPSGSAETATRC